MLENRAPVGACEGQIAFPPDDGFAKKHPLVWEYLTSAAWADGTERIPSTVSIFPQQGRWTVMLCEKNWGLILFATADRIGGIWVALEARLGDPQADWRLDRKSSEQKARRVRPTTGQGGR